MTQLSQEEVDETNAEYLNRLMEKYQANRGKTELQERRERCLELACISVQGNNLRDKHFFHNQSKLLIERAIKFEEYLTGNYTG